MKSHFILTTKRLLFLFALYTFFRIYFFIYNFADYKDIPSAEVLRSFFMGTRFDWAAIFILNGFFFIIWLLPFQQVHRGIMGRSLMLLFCVVNIICAAMNLADAELIHFSGQKLTLNYFKIAEDIRHQSLQLIYHYWFTALLVVFSGFLIVRYFPKYNGEEYQKRWHHYGLVTLVFLLTAGFGIRGGLQNKPLREAHAYSFSNNQLGHLAINSTFTFLRSLKSKSQQKLNFYSDDEISKILKRDRTAHFKNKWREPQNVVIIILESWALEFVGAANGGAGYTPFFDDLAKRGLLFTNFFANGRRSIEAIPSILSSIPSLLNEAFLTSSYQGIHINGLGDILRDRGYSTAFFHGATNGSMFFDSYTMRLGFQKYYGLNEYPNKEKDWDGFWGIFDEPFFTFVAQELGRIKKPFAVSMFSLSSHQPFTLPAQYIGKFNPGTLPVHPTIAYADLALKKFFEEAEKQDWYKNTLFVITGDHTTVSDQKKYQDTLGPYRVPLLLFHPQIQWPKVNLERAAQHADILPTVLDVIDVIDEEKNKLSDVGTSVFSNDDDAFVVNKPADGFWYLSGEHFIKLDPQLKLIEPAQLSPDDVHWARLKAYLQKFVNGVIDNKLYNDRQ